MTPERTLRISARGLSLAGFRSSSRVYYSIVIRAEYSIVSRVYSRAYKVQQSIVGYRSTESIV